MCSLPGIGRGLILTIALVLGLGLGLTGCSPSDLGLTGIAVDEQGAPVVVLAVCQNSIADAGITDLGADGTASLSAGRWTAAKPVTKGLTVLPVTAPPPGWTETKPRKPLLAGVRYRAYGSGEEDDAVTHGVDFDLADLRQLNPGTVFYQELLEVKHGVASPHDRTVPISDFLKAACGPSR